MKILACDSAAERPDRGYAILELTPPSPTRALCWTGVAPPGPEHGPIDVVVSERPWTVQGRGASTRGKLTGERLITFCVNNGFQARDAWPWSPESPPLFVQLPVRIWKDLALPGCAGMQGDIFCNNLRQKYAPGETNHNILDAIGMAHAAARLSLAQLRKYVPKGFRR